MVVPSTLPSFLRSFLPRYPVLYLYCMYDVAGVGASGRLEALLLHSTLPVLQGFISEAAGADAERHLEEAVGDAGAGLETCTALTWLNRLPRLMIAERARLLRCELRNHKPLFGNLRLSLSKLRAPLLHNLHFGWM